MIVVLNSGHMDIYTVYKQCSEECSSKVISTIWHKCSVFQLFTDRLAHNILGCDNRACKLSVSFASLNLSSRRLSTRSPCQAVARWGLCFGSLSDAGLRGDVDGARGSPQSGAWAVCPSWIGRQHAAVSFRALGLSLRKLEDTVPQVCAGI